jgi:hypothetical protein
MGQRYSFLEREADVRVWALKELSGTAEDFRRVQLDAMA